MKRIVWTFGLISGAVLAVTMLLSIFFINDMGTKGEIVGYTSMVVSFLMVYFGIRTYRDNVLGGLIGFGKAFQVGILIAVIGSMCYVATWEVLFFQGPGNFGEKFSAKMIESAKKPGASQQETDAKVAKMKEFQAMYRNPFINSAMTFLEAFPVGLVITLVSAGVLSRARGSRSASSLSHQHPTSEAL